MAHYRCELFFPNAGVYQVQKKVNLPLTIGMDVLYVYATGLNIAYLIHFIIVFVLKSLPNSTFEVFFLHAVLSFRGPGIVPGEFMCILAPQTDGRVVIDFFFFRSYFTYNFPF